MNRDAWLIFIGITVVAAIGLLGANAWQKQKEIEGLRSQLLAARQTTATQASRLTDSERRLTSAEERASKLENDVAASARTRQRLETEMRAALRSREVAISELQGQLTVSILDRILFDSGDATLKPEGTQVLDQIAHVLAGFTNRHVQVFGHTDNVPIRLKYASNWELSAARAVSAVRYLTERAGVDPHRLSAVAAGEFQPIASNATAEGRAQNRRIALVVLPEQFVASDVTGDSTTTSTSTNTSPDTGSGGGTSTNAPSGSTPSGSVPATPAPQGTPPAAAEAATVTHATPERVTPTTPTTPAAPTTPSPAATETTPSTTPPPAPAPGGTPTP